MVFPANFTQVGEFTYPGGLFRPLVFEQPPVGQVGQFTYLGSQRRPQLVLQPQDLQ